MSCTYALTFHPLDKTLLSNEFSTTIEVYRDPEDGQLKVAASYAVPGNSPSVNEIDIKSVSFTDLCEIMRIAATQMLLTDQKMVRMELKNDPNILFFV